MEYKTTKLVYVVVWRDSTEQTTYLSYAFESKDKAQAYAETMNNARDAYDDMVYEVEEVSCVYENEN